jgi:RNA polymerase sigma-70 factor, ECF subfamily
VNYTELSDPDLIKLVQADPQNHFEGLLSRYEKQVFVYALRILNYNQENTEDVCSEVWFKCYKSILIFDTKKKFISWIYQITHNQAIDYIRKHHKILTQDIDTSSGLFYIDTKSTFKDDKIAYITHILQHLDPHDRSILTLHYLEEKTIPEISEIFKLLPKLISLKLFRAKKRAQKIAQKLYPDLILD